MRELQSQNVQEAGAEAADYSDLQVLLTSSQDFGPASIRDLTVRPTCDRVSAPGQSIITVQMPLLLKRSVFDCMFRLKTDAAPVCCLQSSHVSQLVKIPGIITAATKPRVGIPLVAGIPARVYSRFVMPT